MAPVPETLIDREPLQTRSENDGPGDGRNLSAILRRVAEDERGSVSLGNLAAALGGRAHALALLVLVLPETIPLPVPSISIVLGIPLIAIAAHLVIHGDGSALPSRFRDMQVPTSAVRAVNRWVGPFLAWLERASKPRWRELAEHPRLVGLVCLYLAVVLALPIPFVNLIPALCLAAVTLGLIRRDGLYVALGVAGTLILTGALVATLVLATKTLGGMFS